MNYYIYVVCNKNEVSKDYWNFQMVIQLEKQMIGTA